jgi:hypothetical protein
MAEYIEFENLRPGMVFFTRSSYHHKKFYQYLLVTNNASGVVQGQLVTFTFYGDATSPSSLDLNPGSVTKVTKGFYNDRVFTRVSPAMKKRLIRFLFMNPGKLT